MGYKDKERQKQYQREWMKNRRLEWVAANGPCKVCGSSENLRVVSETRKERFQNCIWGYSEEGRKTALEGCVVMCRAHAVEFWGKNLSKKFVGRKGDATRFTAGEIWAIRGRLLGRESTRDIAQAYGVTHSAILDIQYGNVWSWLKGSGRREVYGVMSIKKPTKPVPKRASTRPKKEVP